MTRTALWLGALAGFAACTMQRSVGSTCDDGVCETLSSTSRVPCLLSTSETLAGIDQPCFVGQHQIHEDGTISCRMYVRLADPSVPCSRVSFTEVSGLDTGEPPLCEVPQLTTMNRSPAGGMATGWYVEQVVDPGDTCFDITTQRLVIDGPLPQLSESFGTCGEALVNPANVLPTLRTGADPLEIPPDNCASLPPLPSRTPSDIGAICEPHVEPVDGFLSDRNYVDVRSEQCGSGVCLINSLGVPGSMCMTEQGPCETQLDLVDRVYCSCRCDAKGDGSRAECACPSGFQCVDVLSDAVPRTAAGGYCVRDDFR